MVAATIVPMRALPLVGLLALTYGVVFGEAALAHATGNGHHTGARTIEQNWGAYAEIEVTNADVPGNTIMFFGPCIMVKQGPGTAPNPDCPNGAPISWLQIGWAETGFSMAGGQPRRAIYVWDTVDCDWIFWDAQYPIAVGQKIYVRVVPSGACTFAPPCTRRAELFWSGSWPLLRSVSLPINYSGFIEEMSEIYIDPSASCHWNIAGASQGYNVNFDNTRLRESSGAMNPWTEASVAGDASPYVTDWGQLSNYFSARRTHPEGCS